jgi:hypothetical protein
MLRIDSPLLIRLVARLPELAEELLDAAVSVFPALRTVPDGHFSEEVGIPLTATLSAVVQAIAGDRPITTADVAEFVGPATERHAEDGIPLATLMVALHAGVEHFWNLAVSLTTPEDVASLISINFRLLEVLKASTVVVSETYADTAQSLYSAGVEANQNICNALLRGEPVEDTSAGAKVLLADRYQVVALQVGSGAQPTLSGEVLVARRRARWVRRVFDDLVGWNVLNTFDGCRGIVLIPCAQEDDDSIAVAAAREVVRATQDRVQANIYAGTCRAEQRAAIPTAADDSRALAELAHRLGKPPGVFAMADLLLEFQLTRPSQVRNQIRATLTPFEAQPHLMEALTIHLKHGVDRKSAAAELFVHPNTLSYRLRRIGELTGIDPKTPDGSRLFAAALTIRNMES